ncbi:hypothetical protein ACH5RR_002974 [Cinchona calisaya]|uniref:Maturase K n=1 Tax=Cinchona calisaya TaxID=153742 RepID=A0ABD3ATU9_9GENT
MHISSLLYYYKSDRAINTRYREIWYAFILQYKFLRVLDLGNARIGSSADTSDLLNITELVHLRRLTGVQKLGCKFSNSWDDSTGSNLFPVLDILKELESLKVFFRGIRGARMGNERW